MAPARSYLDHNATSPVRPEVLEAVASVLPRAGNPSSVHAEGRAARALLERARSQVAALVAARPERVIFTSGGTEANATALRPGALLGHDGRPAERLVVPGTEHPSVLGGHGFPEGHVSELDVGPDGIVAAASVAQAVRGAGGDALLLSVQLANSETGIVQPVRELAAVVRSAGGVVHSDAVQVAGRQPVDMDALGLDAVTLSGHKLGAPAGIGALVVADDRAGPGLALLRGGGQEARLRAGTENVVGIVAMGVAAEAAVRDLAAEAARLRALRDAVERDVLRIAPEAVIFGRETARLPNTLSFSVPGLSAETVLMSLDLDGVAVSSGSACTSGKVARSHVLAAMGVPGDLARGAIRVSLGWTSRETDVAAFAKAFEIVVRRLYEGRRARAA